MIDALWIILTTIFHASCQAAIVAFLILGIQFSLGRRISPNWRIALWSLVILRLITPTLPASRFSLSNLFRPASSNSLPTTPDPQTTIIFGIITDTPTPAPHPPASIAPTISHAPDWRLLPLGVWAFGTFMLLMRLAISQTLLLHRLRSSRVVQDARLIQLLADCQHSLHAPTTRCIEADWISAPALCGLCHHTLLLPINFSNTLSDSDLRFILMHELIHARRRDLLLDRLIALVIAFHWFNPAAWLAWRRIRTERELACDQAVLQSTAPAARLNYGQTLLTITERLTTRPNSLLSIGVADRHCSMRRRLLAIVHPPQHWKLQNLIATLCITIVTLAAFTSAETNSTTIASSQPTTIPVGMILRTYDIAPLLISIPNIESPPQLNSTAPQPPSTRPTKPPPTRQQVAQKFISDIQSRIDPPSWNFASISESDGKLRVVQTPANQDAIWKDLSCRLANRSITVTVETNFLRLSPAILSQWKARHPSQPLTADAITFSKANLDELLRMCQADPQSSTLAAPRLTLFNGEHGWIEMATITAYVRDFHPKNSTTHPTQPEFDPEISKVEAGVLIDVRAILSADHHYVTLDLKDQESDLLAMKRVSWPQAPPGRPDLIIQVPTVREQKLNVSVNLPNDGYFAGHPAQTIQPAGAIPPDKNITLMIIHATIGSLQHPPKSIPTTVPSDLKRFVMPQS